MDRRIFLKTMTLGAGLTVSAGPILAAERAADNVSTGIHPPGGTPGATSETPRVVRRGDMIYRMLGRTGEWVSALGLGGSHIGQQKDAKESIKIIRSAIDGGITFMDNSWDYHDGQSELRMGEALRDGYRDRVFLMTKVDGQTRESSRRQLEESLKRFKVDHVDLWQFHEIIRIEDPERIFAEDGAIHTALKARDDGKIRFIGFTGHKDPKIHLHMLETARKHDFHFDTVQMPLNIMDASYRSFQQDVLPVLLRDQIGVLGMKPLGGGILLESGVAAPTDFLAYALSLPTAVVITGIDSMEILKQNLDLMRDFEALSATEMAALESKASQAAAAGKYEKFKTSNTFDSTIQNPQWLG